MIRIIYLVIAISLCDVNAQVISFGTIRDSSRRENSLRFGFDKVFNTFLFRGDLDYLTNVGNGSLSLQQHYRGSGIRASTSAFRDDEFASITYQTGITESIEFLSKNDLRIARDSRSIGLSSLTQMSAAVGARFTHDSTWRSELSSGVESNKLLGIPDFGSVLRAAVVARNAEFDHYLLSADATADFSIFPRRTNGDVSVAASLRREFDNRNRLNFTSSARILNRDWYTNLSTPQVTLSAVESRLERRLASDILLQLGVSRSIDVEFNAGINSLSVRRSFKDYASWEQSTAAHRELSEILISMISTASYRDELQYHTLSLSLWSRDEQNTASQNFSFADPAQIDSVREQQRQRDNLSSRARIGMQSLLQLTRRDTCTLSANYSVLHYDTPSLANFDDRDELVYSISTALGHRFSSALAANVQVQVQANHLVYLSSNRSAANNWNRSIRLIPSMNYSAYGFSLQQHFELMAQYTIYDFEYKAGVPTSFSFRQIISRDSLSYVVNDQYRVDAQLFLRYFERAELYWTDFAEYPQTGSYEQFARLMCSHSLPDNSTFGIGCRWYAFSQRSLTSLSTPNSLLQSIAPECSFSLYLSSTSKLIVSGWYEFQYLDTRHLRNLPNLSLNLTREL